MKKIISAIFMALAIIASSSCSKQEVDGSEAQTISVKENNLKIPAKGGEGTIEFVTESPIEVTVDKDWCQVSVKDNVATVTAPANESYESRYATVTVKSGDAKSDFTVQQFGFYSTGFNPSGIKASHKAVSFDFPYEYDETITASADVDWITVTVTENNLNVAIAENTIKGTPADMSRSGNVEWKLGHDSGVISVVQNNLSYMSVDANWTVRYGGIKDYEGKQAAYIYNDVADPALSGKYSIYYVSKSEFTESGLEMDDFAIEVADAVRKEIMYIVEFYNQIGSPVEFSTFLYEDSDYEVFDPMDAGDYIAFAIGFTDDGAATGHYAYSDFTVTSGGGGSAEGYDAWLGDWTVTRGSATDTWKISTLEKGTSYTITGIEGQSFPVTATYDSATKGIEVRAQDGLGTVSTQKYGECTVGLFGGWGESSFATGKYVIFTGTISGSTAKLAAGHVSFSDGSSYDLERVQFVAATADGKYLTISKDKTPLPTTLTKKGGSGDNPGGGGSDAYKKWLGNWSINAGAFDIALTQKVADKTINMKGWQMDQDFFEPAEVTFDSESGSIVLYGNDDEPIADNVDIGASEGACNLYYVGKFIHTDGKEYYITSGGNGAYDVATGTLQSDGSVKFTGNSFQLQGGGDFTYNRMELIAVPISDPDGGVYTFKSKPDEFPLTGVKSGTTSVKTMSLDKTKGTWVKVDRNSFRTISANRPFEFCTPYKALPEVSHLLGKRIVVK